MPWLALGAGLASGIGSALANSSANDRAKMFQNQALQQFLAVNVPDPEQQKIVLDKFINQGQLDPVLQKAISQNPSEFEKIVTNSRYQAAQNKALSELENIGYSGGLRLQDKAALQDAMIKSQTQDRANRDAIESEMARRGLGGSGFDVAARLSNQQATSDRNANNSLSVAAKAQDRALAAIEGAGSMASDYRNQDFNQQAAKASAADRINQFNTANLRDVNAANVGLQNYAQQYNLTNKQNIANKNTDLANQQQIYNKNLIQQQYDNELKKAAGSSGQYANLANSEQRGGQIAGNAISNIGGSIAGAATAQANNDFWDKYFENQKTQNGSGYTLPQNLEDSINKVR